MEQHVPSAGLRVSITPPPTMPDDALGTGATPHMRGVNLGSPGDQPPEWLLNPLSPSSALAPKVPRSDDTMPSPQSKTPRHSGDADVSQSRTQSLDADENALEAARIAAGCDAATATGSTSSQRAVSGGLAELRGSSSSEDEDDEANMLKRLTAAAAFRRSAQQSNRSTPPTPQARRRTGTPGGGPPAATPPPVAPNEEGWDSVGARRSSRKSTTPGAARTESGSAEGVTPAAASTEHDGSLPTSAGGSASGGGGSGGGAAGGAAGRAAAADEAACSGDELYDAYAAAKDGSRRKVGKHSRSARLVVQRQQSIDARMRQRSGD